MSNSKLLTILIPVYNGQRFIGGLLESFASFAKTEILGREFLSDCEILVVNNCSEDDTLEIATTFESRLANLRIVTPDEHVPSAEQNVFRAFSLARGEYTWVLGVDDIVRFEAISDVMRTAREGVYDIAIFNFMLSDENGYIERMSYGYMKEKVYEADLVSLTQKVGFWWLIAGFSGQIVRTSRVAGYDHSGLVAKTSPIYSHVTAYLECLAGRPAAIINSQNVIYRMSYTDISHWRRAAARLNVFDEYFWTLGYIRQIKYLEQKGVVGRDYLIKMVETNSGNFFRPACVIYDKILTQLMAMRASSEPRNHIRRGEFEEMVTYFETRDLLARPLLFSLRSIFDSLESNVPVSDREIEITRWRIQCYQSSFLLAPNFAGTDGDYEIYHFADRYYAVHRLFRGAILDRMRYLDHVEEAPIVLEAKTRDELTARIAKDGVDTNLDSVPSSLMRYCSQPLDHGTQAWHPSPPPRHESSHSPAASSAMTCALSTAQWELRAAYKSRGPFYVRLGAWCGAQGLKIARWMIATGRKRSAKPQISTSAA